jgi:hypothetical protein
LKKLSHSLKTTFAKQGPPQLALLATRLWSLLLALVPGQRPVSGRIWSMADRVGASHRGHET